MRTTAIAAAILLSCTLCFVGGQRITTIQLDGVQYFISRMNPYSPALNYFLAYQYCRSLGLQLASFETKEKADSITQYLTNAGYNEYNFWISGNRLGRDMFLWMSTGLPFNVTFNYMREIDDSEVPPTLIGSGPIGEPGDEEVERPEEEQPPQYAEGKSRGRQLTTKSDGACVALSAPDLKWDVDDCNADKHFICEQTRCYYYNYGSIPVSASQGPIRRPVATTTTPPPPTTTTMAATTTTQAPEEPLTTTTVKTSSSPSFKVNRRITLRPVHFPNLGSLLASPWSSSLAPSPVYHHGKSGKVEKSAENTLVTVQDIISSLVTKAEESTNHPEIETTPMNEDDPSFPNGRKETIDWGDMGAKTTEAQA